MLSGKEESFVAAHHRIAGITLSSPPYVSQAVNGPPRARHCPLLTDCLYCPLVMLSTKIPALCPSRRLVDEAANGKDDRATSDASDALLAYMDGGQ